MSIEQYFEETMSPNDFHGEHKSCSEKWQQSVSSSDDNTSSGFDCNICLDSVQEPVVTLCGHLFCWPCIYKWLRFQSASSGHEDEQQLQCPVCKAEVSQATLIPLYGRSQTTKPRNLSPVIPRRPQGPICGVDTPRSPSTFTSPRITQQAQPYYQHLGSYTTSSTLNMGGIAANVSHPIIGMFGEMVYARVFGNSVTNLYSNSYHLAGTNSSRVRRHVMHADRSLSRICFFLFCCVMLCLLLF